MLDNLSEVLSQPKNEDFKQKLTRLVKAADTKVEEILIGSLNQREAKGLENSPMPEELKVGIRQRKRLLARHQVFENGQVVGFEDFKFLSDTSEGTNMMLVIGALILFKLENGGLVVFDELDNSLHPKISRFFIQLFHSLNVNKGNAQIVFSTHEPLLMDKDMFRSDQIWFTQKTQFGETELYSAQDFDGVREDIPFDKWYMAGKFGALPNIEESLFAF